MSGKTMKSDGGSAAAVWTLADAQTAHRATVEVSFFMATDYRVEGVGWRHPTHHATNQSSLGRDSFLSRLNLKKSPGA